MSPYPVVTIDGPAGAGKSTVARELARRLGYAYVNSGAIYRAVAWRASTGGGVAGPTLVELLATIRVELRAGAEGQRVVVDGQDVTEALRAPPMSDLTSSLSQRPEVRAFADALQRRLAAEGPVVVEGRDAGTVVFPEADCKFYLDASLEARARRRLADRRGSGEGGELVAIRAAILTGDRADQTRAVAPLARATEATYVDSSEMTVDEVVELMAKDVERVCSTR